MSLLIAPEFEAECTYRILETSEPALMPLSNSEFGRDASLHPPNEPLENANGKMNKYHQPHPTKSTATFLRLNISGREYDVPESVARSHVGSVFALLASSGYAHSEFDESERRRILAMRRISNIHQRWFIERTPSMFELVLQYLYTRHLHCPVSVCDQALQDEVKFWRLQKVSVADCCWGNSDQIDDDDTSVENFSNAGFDSADDEETKQSERKESRMSQNQPQHTRLSNGKRMSLADALKVGFSARKRRWNKTKRFLWKLCHGPSSWMPARVFNGLCVLFILVSIINLMLSTIPELQCDDDKPKNNTTTNSSHNGTPPAQHGPLLLSDKFDLGCPSELAFDIIEAICIAWFTVEIILRFISSPDKRIFLKSPMNIIDILATAPYYVEMLLKGVGAAGTSDLSTLMVVLRILRMLRIFRVLRLARYFDSLKVFGDTVAKSKQELGVLAMFLMLSVVIFSSLMYYIEKDTEDTAFISIPASFYYAVVTLTTVGYGDVTPKTTLGKICCGLACVTGILILAFPVSILVERFNESYKAKRSRRRRFFEQDQQGNRPAATFQYSEHPVSSTVQNLSSSASSQQLMRSDSNASHVTGLPIEAEIVGGKPVFHNMDLETPKQTRKRSLVSTTSVARSVARDGHRRPFN